MKETLKILSFQTAMVMQNEREKYDQTKWIYVPDFYTDYRYILGTVGNNPLITIGINPSTAEPEKMDNTMKSVEKIAMGNGFDSFIMFNVYAQRATDPNQMNKEINPMLHKENIRFILKKVSLYHQMNGGIEMNQLVIGKYISLK